MTDIAAYLHRLLGFERSAVVERSLRSIAVALISRASELHVIANEDPMPIAHQIHRLVRGSHTPFVVADPRRAVEAPDVRTPPSRRTIAAAVAAARDGTICLRAHHLPRDWWLSMEVLRRSSARIVVCSTRLDMLDVVLPEPIDVPTLAHRPGEIDRVIDGYVVDAQAEFGGDLDSADREWIRDHCTTHHEIEKATRRIMAIRMSDNQTSAADLLGMRRISLTRWFRRRQFTRLTPLPPDQRFRLRRTHDVLGN